MTSFSGRDYIYVSLLGQSFWAVSNRSTSKLDFLDCPSCSDNRFPTVLYDSLADVFVSLSRITGVRRSVWREFEGHRRLTIVDSWFACCINDFEK